MHVRSLFLSFFLVSVSWNVKASFAELVHNRFYYIKRLELVMPLLLKHVAESPLLIQQSFLEFQKKVFFYNPIICQIVDDICVSHDVQEIEALWEMFFRYRYINDTLFLKEFIKLIALISLVLVVHEPSYELLETKAITFLHQATHNLSSDALLCFVHACMDYMQAKKGIYSLEKKEAYIWNICNVIKSEEDEYQQSKNLLLNIDLIAERFYFVQRMDAAMSFLKCCAEKHLFAKNHLFKKLIFKNYSHGLIIQVGQSMLADQNLNALFLLWDLLKAYEYIEDRLLVEEFAHFILSLYKELCMAYVGDDIKYLMQGRENAAFSLQKDPFLKDQKTVLEYIVTLYQIIDRLPLNEILDAIDILSRELPLLIQHTEFSVPVSWKQWLKKYWWIPPFVVAALGFKFLKRLAYGHFTNFFSTHTSILMQNGAKESIPSLIPDIAVATGTLVRPSSIQLIR